MVEPQSTGANYYSENYSNYEEQSSENKLKFYEQLMSKWVPPHGKIYELGCAMGHFLQRVVSKYECSGSDVNEFGVKTAKEKLPNTPLFVGSYEQIPNEEFDAVVSWDVLEHLPNLSEGLSTIHSRLKKGGVLIGVVPIYDGALGWVVRLLDRDPTHVTKVGRKDWIQSLGDAGFKIVEKGGILRKLVGTKYLHFTAPQKILWHSGSAMYFVARK